MAESYLKSEFTSLGGANVDAGVLRSTIESNGIIVVALADGPTALRWIDEVADPTFEITFVSTLPAPQVTELDILIAAHAGPPDVSQAMRVFFESAAPLVTDDEDKLFEIGDLWHDSVTSHAYILTDATAGAAAWLWASGWGLARPTDVPKLRSNLKLGGGSNPDANKVIVADGSGDWDLNDYGGTQDRGYFEDYGTQTSVSNGTATRMDETPTLLAGRYELGWTSEVDTDSNNSDVIARFIFAGSTIDVMTVTDRPMASTKFNGRVERVITAGSKNMKLEVEEVGSSGNARMRQSTMWYRYISAT